MSTFSSPTGIALTGSSLAVSDTTNNRVVLLTTVFVYSSMFGSSGSGNGQFSSPKGVAYDASGNIYVVDSGNNRVQKFTSAGVYSAQFGSAGSGNGQFSSPDRIWIDSSGNIYVSDAGNHRIQKFNSSHTFIKTWGTSGSSAGQFSSPSGVAISPDNSLAYVVDKGNSRVQVFNEFSASAAQWKAILGTSGNGATALQLSSPEGLFIDSDGALYIADTGNHRIVKVSRYGKLIGTYGSSGSGDGQFSSPSDIAVSGTSIFVVDRGNNRIQKFTQTVTYADAQDAQTEWNVYLEGGTSGSREVSIGTPDRGVHTPNLYAFDMGVPSSEHPSSHQSLNPRTTKYLSILRKRLEQLAASGAFLNPDTGVPYDWTEGTENLYRRAMTGKHTTFGITQVAGDAKRTWTRGALIGQKMQDIDVGEIHHVIDRLKKATLGQIS